MPTFPVYNSESNINTNIQPPERHQAGEVFKDIQNVNKTIIDLTQQWSDRNDVMQETKAKTQAEIAFAQQEQAAMNDPDPNNVATHVKALSDITKNVTKGIDNQEVAGQVGLDIQQSAFLSGIKIQDIFKKKQIFANDQNLDQLSTTAAHNVANAVSPAAGQQDEDNFMATINSNVSRGLITPERANSLVKNYKVGVVKNKISNSSSLNEDDYKGIYEGLDLKESNEAQKMVQGHIKQLNEAKISNTFNNRVNILGGVANGQFDWKSADKINDIAKHDPALGSALQMVQDAQINNKEEYEPSSKEGQKYADSVNKLMTSMTVEQVSEYLPSAIEQISKLPAGEMQDRLAVLVNAAQDRAKSLPVKDEQEIPPEIIKQEGGVQAVLRWNKAHGDNDPQTVNEYLKAVHNGSSPAEAYNLAIKTKIVKDHPEVASQSDVPNRIIDNNTKSFHVFTGETKIYPARIWNESLGRFEINPNREQSNDNSTKQTDK